MIFSRYVTVIVGLGILFCLETFGSLSSDLLTMRRCVSEWGVAVGFLGAG